MKLNDILHIKTLLNDIKQISDAQAYSVSSAINQKLVQITPILDVEQQRMETDNVSINCPKILIFTNRDAISSDMTVQDYMNLKLQEIVINSNKVIDYGKLDEEIEDDNTRTIYMYIKYTN